MKHNPSQRTPLSAMISKYVQRKLSSLESAGDRYPNLFLLGGLMFAAIALRFVPAAGSDLQSARQACLTQTHGKGQRTKSKMIRDSGQL